MRGVVLVLYKMCRHTPVLTLQALGLLFEEKLMSCVCVSATSRSLQKKHYCVSSCTVSHWRDMESLHISIHCMASESCRRDLQGEQPPPIPSH